MCARHLAAFCAILAFAWGCSDSNPSGDRDGSVLAPDSATVEAGPAPDSGLDQGSVPDSRPDEGPDLAADRGADLARDLTPDSGPDSGPSPDAGPPAAGWARAAGGTYSDKGQAIVVDSAGNVYVAGTFGSAYNTTATFGSITLTLRGSYNMFVAKLDKSGKFLWVTSALGDTEGHGVAVDSAGNVHVTGTYKNTADFGSIRLISSSLGDMFVARLDKNGKYLWVASSKNGDNIGQAIAVDSAGNSYVTGTFKGRSFFGSTTLSSRGYATKPDVFVTRLDKSGNFVWATSAGGSLNDYVQDIAVDSAGNSTIAGNYYGPASFGSTTLVTTGSNLFVARLDSSGKFLWVSSGGRSSVARGVALGSAGNTTITGEFKGSLNLGSTTLTASGSNEDIFVARLDKNGKFVWAASAGGSSWDVGFGVAVDGFGNSYVTGHYMGTATFGSTTLTVSGANDIFLARLDSSGKFAWATSAGGSSADRGYAVVADGAGGAIVTGECTGPASFGKTTLSTSKVDLFVARANRLGNF